MSAQTMNNRQRSIADIANFFAFTAEIIESLPLSTPVGDLQVDSRMLQAGDVFIAVQGDEKHGLAFLLSALSAKPALILSDRGLTEEESTILESHRDSPVCVTVDNLAAHLASFADWFYGEPSQSLNVIGITGTNGKTSTAFFTAQLLHQLGKKVAVIGTLGNGVFEGMRSTSLSMSGYTTPDVVSVHRTLAEYCQQQVEYVVMEVSSHGLTLGRVRQVHFDTVALTQVTRDHLDFHETEEAYRQAKQSLFTDYVARHQVLNANDEVGRLLLASLQETAQETAWSYGVNVAHSELGCATNQLHASQLLLLPQGIKLTLDCMANNTPLHQTVQIPLMGAFNAENVLCALSIVVASLEEEVVTKLPNIVTGLASLDAVTGRMQTVATDDALTTVIVDFAHTPDALEQVLLATKAHTGNYFDSALWVVFGCGGNRDQGKRPLMASIAERIADYVMVTSDNPRFEEPSIIIEHIFGGFVKPETIFRCEDRRQAIEQVLSQAKPTDVVLIAGKGHENYQEVQGVKQPFSDIAVVEAWNAAHGK